MGFIAILHHHLGEYGWNFFKSKHQTVASPRNWPVGKFVNVEVRCYHVFAGKDPHLKWQMLDILDKFWRQTNLTAAFQSCETQDED